MFIDVLIHLNSLLSGFSTIVHLEEKKKFFLHLQILLNTFKVASEI